MNKELMEREIFREIDGLRDLESLNDKRIVKIVGDLLPKYWLSIMDDELVNVPNSKKKAVCNNMVNFIVRGIDRGYFTKDNIVEVLKSLAHIKHFSNLQPGSIFGQMSDVGDNLNSPKTLGLDFQFSGDFLRHIIYHELSHAVTPKLSSSNTPNGKIISRELIRNLPNKVFKLKKPFVSEKREFKFSKDRSVTTFFKEVIAEEMASDLCNDYVKERRVHDKDTGLKSDWWTPYNANYQQIADEFLQTLSFVNTPENNTCHKRISAIAKMSIDTSCHDVLFLEKIEEEFRSKNPEGYNDDLKYFKDFFAELLTHRNMRSEEVEHFRSVLSKYKVDTRSNVSSVESSTRSVSKSTRSSVPKKNKWIPRRASAMESAASGGDMFLSTDYTDEYIEGTNVFKPRPRMIGESDMDYANFLEKYYSYYFPNANGKNIEGLYASFVERFFATPQELKQPVRIKRQSREDSSKNQDQESTTRQRSVVQSMQSSTPKEERKDITTSKQEPIKKTPIVESDEITDTDFVEKQDRIPEVIDDNFRLRRKNDTTVKTVDNDSNNKVVDDIRKINDNNLNIDNIYTDNKSMNNNLKRDDSNTNNMRNHNMPFSEEDFCDELIPGTNMRRPRYRGIYESDEEYVAFLKKFYDYFFPESRKDVTLFKSEDFSDELIPGTNIRKPRCRGIFESDEEYVAFLEKYYDYYFPNNGYSDNNKVYKK